nr:protein kinase family protein [Scopulibacillus darangshiensis]
MKSFCDLAASVCYLERASGFQLVNKDYSLEIVGEGRSAYVFKVRSTKFAIKVFFPPFTELANEEAEIYSILDGNPYFPRLYEAGSNYLVIDFIEGQTLFQCLNKGIEIKNRNILGVDHALSMAEDLGLNPSDIHLRNIILTSEGEIKLIDVARFRQIKNCSQWEDLKKCFYRYYCKWFFPKRIPVAVLNLIAKIYKKRQASINVHD